MCHILKIKSTFPNMLTCEKFLAGVHVSAVSLQRDFLSVTRQYTGECARTTREQKEKRGGPHDS